jgi:choline transport protein
MTASVFVNGLMGFVVILTFGFTLHDLQHTPVNIGSHYHPFIEAYYLATGSKGLTTTSAVMIILLSFSASLSVQASSARHIFAFARDDGLPFPHLWSKVTHVGGRDLPLNSFILSLTVTVAVAVVNLGLRSVLQVSIALFVSSTLTGYLLAIACALKARLSRSVELPDRMWSLGAFSIPVNIIALGYIALLFVLSFFPLQLDLAPSSMNWASLVWLTVLAFASTLYIVHGRYVFKAPVLASRRSFDDRTDSRQA